MGLRVTLDDTILNDTPRGWDDAVIKTKRGKTLKGLFLTYSSDLEFWGDGFDYINDVMEENYCNTIKVTIETDDCGDVGDWVTEFNGIIQIPQISKFDVTQNIIQTKIFDDTFDAKINNNKSIKAFVDVGTSKNGEDITPASPVEIEMFNPTGDFISGWVDCEGFRVFDCFKFIIDYITDGQIGFKSDLFSGEYYNWMLFNGKELRVANPPGGGDQVEVSFKELFQEINKKTNISFAIEPDDDPSFDFRLRLEETSYFEQDDSILTLDNVPNIMMSFNRDELFSNVAIGSKSFDDDLVLSYPPLNIKAFKEENYNLLGQCNIDKTLNLVSKYVIDSNVIEDVVVNNVEKYDKKIFLIVTDGTRAIKYKEYGVPTSEGADTSGTAFKLTDSGATFVTDGVSNGDMVANITTNSNTMVTNVDSETVLSLTANIFSSGDNYQVRKAPFNYNDPLTNIKVIERFSGGLPNSVIKHLSTSSIANFKASTTAELSGSQSPVAFNNDSTPPNFDDGGFYDAITNFDYTIPNNGLYGFKNESSIRLNGGFDSTDEIINGDFSLLTGWQFDAGSITGGKFALNNTSTPTFLKQGSVFESGFKYLLTFYCEVRGCELQILGESIVSDGIYQIVIDNEFGLPLDQFNIPYTGLDFLFVPNFTNDVRVRIDNVSVFKTAKFNIKSKIIKSSNNGVTISEYTKTEDFVFDVFQYQRNFDFLNEATFSTFKGEKITVDFEVTTISGSSTGSTIKTGATFETVLVDDGGGDILPIEESSFPIYKYKFKKGLSFTQFKALKDAPEKAVLFSDLNSGHIFGWRNSIDYDRKTGETKFELRSKTKIKKSCLQE